MSRNIEILTCFTPINTNKQLQVGGGSCTFFPNKFANLREEDIFEEGGKANFLDHYFAMKPGI